jgi:hypothetical protein
MGYINTGAMDERGNRFKTKRALKEALDADPSTVFFDTTSSARHRRHLHRRDSARWRCAVCGWT